jgi:hypothetical protein
VFELPFSSLFTQLGQQVSVQNAVDTAYAAKGETRLTRADVRELRDRVRTLEHHNEQLMLAVTALAEIHCERFGLTTDELADKIREIDLRDGVLDGKVNPQAKRCPNCGRETKPTRTACLYCGTPLPDAPLLGGTE